MMDFALRLISLFVEAVLLFWLLERNYSLKHQNHIWMTAKFVFALVSVAIFAFDPVLQFLHTPNLFFYFFVLTGVGMLYSIFLKGNFACKTLTIMIYLSSSIEIHTFVGTRLFAYLPDHSVIFYQCITKVLLLLVLACMLRFPMCSEYSIPRSYYFLMYLSMAVILSIRAITLFLRLDAMHNLLLMFLYLALYCTYGKLLHDHGKKVHFQLVNNQLEMQITSLKDIETMYQELRKLRHDMKNHLLYMQALLDRQNYSALNEYLCQMNNTNLLMKQALQTGIPPLDAVLNVKSAQCSLLGIPMKSKIILGGQITISDTDLCALVCNLVDNAIEASQQTEESDIDVEIKCSKGYLAIKVSNKFWTNPLENNPALKTNKENAKLHGMGLSIVRDIAKKHRGTHRLVYKDGYVLSSIIIPVASEKIWKPDIIDSQSVAS